jgi:hypothetical protein
MAVCVRRWFSLFSGLWLWLLKAKGSPKVGGWPGERGWVRDWWVGLVFSAFELMSLMAVMFTPFNLQETTNDLIPWIQLA